jgi:Inosine-uridine preferring nucleoside hydrolase
MKVIVDCDSGNDDAWAIISLLRAEHKCDYKVIAITSVHGNTSVDHSSQNTLMILKTLNRLDVPVIVKSKIKILHIKLLKISGLQRRRVKFDQKHQSLRTISWS